MMYKIGISEAIERFERFWCGFQQYFQDATLSEPLKPPSSEILRTGRQS